MARRSSTAQHQRPGKTVERHTGRPTALTERTQETIAGYLIGGMSIESSCNLAGINPATFYRWMQRGEQAREMLDEHGSIPEEEERFREFREAILDARAQAEHKAVSIVMRAMDGGFVTSEEPLLDLDGQPVRDDNGRILYKRTYTPPDGRLALAYLQRARPKDWSVAGANLNVKAEVSGPGGGPIEMTLETTQIENLTAQLAAVKQQHAEGDGLDDDEVYDAEVVEDGEAS